MVGVVGVDAAPIAACRGITPGSGTATSELRLLLLDLVRQASTLHPAALKLYVDDLTITAEGKPTTVARTLAQAASFAARHPEQVLGLIAPAS